jgi:hypothetical protein
MDQRCRGFLVETVQRTYRNRNVNEDKTLWSSNKVYYSSLTYHDSWRSGSAGAVMSSPENLGGIEGKPLVSDAFFGMALTK